MEDRKLNEKESLEIISKMIRNTQSKMEQNIGRPLMILGYVSVIIALGVWYGNVFVGDYRWNFLWFLVPLIGWPIVYKLNSKKQFATTYLDRIIKYVWIVFTVGILLTCSLSVFLWDLDSLFFSAISIGMMAALTGLIVRVNSITISGFVGMLISPVTLFLQDGNQILAIGAMFIVLLIIPGHILHAKNKKQA